MAQDDPRLEGEVRVLSNGRLSVPVDLRRQHGWNPGDRLWLTQTDNGLSMRSIPQQWAHVRAKSRALLGHPAPFTVDQFIEERREEARLELAEDADA